MARSNALGKLRDIVEAVSKDGSDPKEALLKELGDIANEKVLHSQVLVGTFAGSMYHPGTTILKTDRALQEDQFQGSIGQTPRPPLPHVFDGALNRGPVAVVHWICNSYAAFFLG